MFRKKILSSNEEQISLVYFWYIRIRIYLRKNILERFRKFKARRPHRSFKISRKRDYFYIILLTKIFQSSKMFYISDFRIFKILIC